MSRVKNTGLVQGHRSAWDDCHPGCLQSLPASLGARRGSSLGFFSHEGALSLRKLKKLLELGDKVCFPPSSEPLVSQHVRFFFMGLATSV